ANPIHFATADGITVLNGSPLIALMNPITTISENTSTSTAVKVANLSITDDIFGNNTTSLSGSDASSFEIKGNELYLKAGTNLNYNTKSSYSVILSVNDANINKGDSKTFNLSITPVTLPTLSIEAKNSIQSEGNSGTKSFNFIVIRSGDTNSISSANWALTGFGINQANNTDFVGGTLPTGTVSFAAGETSQTITVNVSGDTSVELDEEFIVTLSTPTNATVTTGTAKGTITNDDNNQPKVISGTDQGDIIDATTGQSTVMPGKGDDIIIVNTASVVIIELPNEGNDTVFSSVNYNLAAFPQIENLTLTGTTDINGIGNGKDNVITGNSGQNVLRGLQGNDTFVFNFGDSVVGKPDRIGDFQFGKDKIRVNGLSPSVLTRATNSTASTLDSLVNSVFIDASGAESGNQAFATNSAALVVSTAQGIGGTYLIVNDAIGGFNPATDLVINLTGYSGTLPGVGNIGVSSLSLFV
ncbi:bluetail domain-containing putative surface protein, partial [Cylindrospermopsis raciborskii]|uniref:bluetail domain-containing putative surface protein n=1 Tax=Cylindrospermopsis raciborskii TaxID=77022 RepID=UPI0038D12D01